MRGSWTIAMKDLKQRIRDRSALIVGIVAPLALAAIFSFVFNPIQDVELSAAYLVVDEDGGPAAEFFVDGVLAGIAQDPGISVTEVGSVAEAEQLLDVEIQPFSETEAADAAFVIPSGFSEAIASPEPAELQVLARRGAQFAGGVAVAIAEQYVSQMQTARVAVATAENFGVQGDRGLIGIQALQVENTVNVVPADASSKILSGTTFYAAGLAIFFLFFTVQFGVNGLLEERHNGTLARLLTTPIPAMSVVLGKAITAFILGVTSMIVLVVATTVMFGADWGDPVGVVALILSGIFAAMGIMAIVAAFAKTAEQSAVFSSIIAVILGFLGGTFFPIGQTGGLLSQLRFITPHAWFMQGLGDLSAGALSDIVIPVLALLIFGFAAGSIALIGVRRGITA